MRRRDEQGFAVLFTGFMAGLLVVLGMVAVGVAGLVSAHRQAAAAADLAALAGAADHQLGRDGCVRAAIIASKNQARLARCRVSGYVVVVETAVVAPGPLAAWPMRGRARAGPVGLTGD